VRPDARRHDTPAEASVTRKELTARVNHAQPGSTHGENTVMTQPSCSHRKSALAGTLALLLGAGLTSAFASSTFASASTSVASYRATSSLQGFVTSPATVQVAGTVTDQVSVRPRAKRLVRVQARRPGSTSFVTVSSHYSTKAGDFRAVYKPTTVGTWRFRLFLPATTRARQLVSASRTITATKPTVPQVEVTTAVLSLNGSKGTTAKQTVNLSEAFVITGTHAGTGRSLESGTLDYGDGTTPERFAGDPAGWTPKPHQYTEPGTFTAKWTVVDSAGTSAATTLDVQMFAEPTATISIGSKSELEKGKPVSFTVTSHTPVGTSFVGFDTYSLQGTTFSNPVHGAGAPPATFPITFANPGTYTVYVTGDNDAGGLAEASVRVVIVDHPKS